MAEEKKVTTQESDTAKAPKADKSKKVSLWKRFCAWLRTYKAELKKIVWASPSSVVNNTALVLVFTLIISAVIGILDYAFNQAINGLSLLNLFS